MSNVKTRFAPSPTGMLHIGGARTALFNQLFAHHHGGEFLLRIEDTDAARNTPENVQAILDGLEWMGLVPDQEPIFQSTRITRHQEVVQELLDKGKAYRCYCTPEELTEMRARAQAEKRAFLYTGVWRDRTPDEWTKDQPYVVRIKAPQDGGSMIIPDLVQGDVKVDHAILDDMILLRSDGTPVYMLAVVVDDHDMAITHVIRGDDHLSNTFRQAMIWDAMGWERPRFAHLPLIHGPDGKKYSKRHGAVGVEEFAEQGYFPEAVGQYLLQMGWWHEGLDDMSTDQAKKYFDLTHMNRASARMDFAKLDHINAAWMKKVADERLLSDLTSRFTNKAAAKGWSREAVATAVQAAQKILPEMRERARTLVELAANAEFLLATEWTEKGEKLVQANLEILSRLQSILEHVEWNKEPLHSAIVSLATELNVKIAAVAQPLRAALTGSTTSPPIDAVMVGLGREQAISRIEAARTLYSATSLKI